MGNVLNIIISLLPMLREYFSKNKGLNTVSGGFLGGLLAVVAMGLQQTGSVDQLITWLQNQGETGLIAGAVVAGLRVAVFAYKGSKAK